jgi:peptidoglycan-N-acetylglucosamine deacetylase
MTLSISAAVGERGVNKPDDVATVQRLFNRFRTPKLTESKECPADVLKDLQSGSRTSTASAPKTAAKGPPKPPQAANLKCWPETIKAIWEFQKECKRKGFKDFPEPDGTVSPGRATWRRLVAAADELGQGRKLLLTFDDGPEPKADLKKILDILNTNTPPIKAEFYLNGNEVEASHDAAKLIVDSGHRIQNHSYTHPETLVKMSLEKVRDEVKKTQDAIKKVTGVTCTKFRPPFGNGGWPGKIDSEVGQVAKELSLAIENWNIDTLDWASPRGLLPSGAEEKKLDMIAEQFWMKNQPPVLTVLMHVQEETARDLQGFISRLAKWGFTFSPPA